MNDDPRLAAVLRALATGSAVDWDAVEAIPDDESSSSLIAELKVLNQIAEVHGTTRRNSEAAGTDEEPLRRWGR